jgi:nuclear transport factor 2 (NTF2) superfamily protein
MNWGQWYRSYGNELWEFDDEGLMRRRLASINDAPITEKGRCVRRTEHAELGGGKGHGRSAKKAAAVMLDFSGHL